ncbi:hypothetical protein [Lactococcus cremoris]|nr:hypothetical protein [Lactococcus cremoris]WKD56500.1 hypothetical protein LLW34_02670 [Lactococcus cremoris]
MTDDERKHQLDLAEKLSGIELVEYFPILPDGSLDLDNPCYAPKQL